MSEQEKKSLFSKDKKKREDHKGAFARVFEREKVVMLVTRHSYHSGVRL